MGISQQQHDFAEFQARTSAKSGTPGLDLAVVRDIIDSYQRASAEPEGVSYAR
jgi:hypothetical protein